MSTTDRTGAGATLFAIVGAGSETGWLLRRKVEGIGFTVDINIV
jgi:hypothetical protein